MELAIGKADFARALSNVARIIEPRNTIPVLSHVKLSAADGILSVTGTDLDIVATDTCPAAGKGGSVCVDAKLLTAIVGKAAGDVTISLKDGELAVKSGRSKFKLQTLPAEDFPMLPEGQYVAEFTVDLAKLAKPIQFAVNQKDHRAALTGTLIRGDVARLAVVATDGHRLVEKRADSVGAFPDVILTPKTVSAIPDGEITVRVSSERIQFVSGGFTVTSKLIEAEYPPYERLIPPTAAYEILVDRDDLAAAAARVGLVADIRGNSMHFNVEGETVTLSMRCNAEAADEVEVEYEGEPRSPIFNVAYLGHILAALPEGAVRISLGDEPMQPAKFLPANDNGTTCVLMPMRA